MDTITVAVGVLTDSARRVLVSRRPPHAHQGGLWEFPGGKVDPGESIGEALARELLEELGIVVESSEPLMVLEHDYGDKCVRLDVHRVLHWRGEPRGLEAQPLAWKLPEDLLGWSFPAANTPILERLIAV
ncbi:MAG: NUDIX domain-containing protein [Luminiphilus sp.]|jgi:8-oxo-dGTP diphosphatase|nr:NUDIX domain-containing protein [Luminiphilus sp.]